MSEKELTELEYVREMMEDFDLTPEDTLADLLEALVDEENAIPEEN